MRKLLFTALFGATVLSACVVPGPRGPEVIAPPLPPLVILDAEPYYYSGGYYYYWHDNGWYYSARRRGPWTILPRDRYPRELRYRGERHQWRDRYNRYDNDRGRERDRGRDRDRDWGR